MDQFTGLSKGDGLSNTLDEREHNSNAACNSNGTNQNNNSEREDNVMKNVRSSGNELRDSNTTTRGLPDPLRNDCIEQSNLSTPQLILVEYILNDDDDDDKYNRKAECFLNLREANNVPIRDDEKISMPDDASIRLYEKSKQPLNSSRIESEQRNPSARSESPVDGGSVRLHDDASSLRDQHQNNRTPGDTSDIEGKNDDESTSQQLLVDFILHKHGELDSGKKENKGETKGCVNGRDSKEKVPGPSTIRLPDVIFPLTDAERQLNNNHLELEHSPSDPAVSLDSPVGSSVRFGDRPTRISSSFLNSNDTSLSELKHTILNLSVTSRINVSDLIKESPHDNDLCDDNIKDASVLPVNVTPNQGESTGQRKGPFWRFSGRSSLDGQEVVESRTGPGFNRDNSDSYNTVGTDTRTSGSYPMDDDNSSTGRSSVSGQAREYNLPIAAEVVTKEPSFNLKREQLLLAHAQPIKIMKKWKRVMLGVAVFTFLVSVVVVVVVIATKKKNKATQQENTGAYNPPTFPPPTKAPVVTHYRYGWKRFGDNSMRSGKPGDDAGYSVSISGVGNIVAVGAPGVPELENDSHVYIYSLQNKSMWLKSIQINSIEPYDETGRSVALNYYGSIVALGSPLPDNMSSNSSYSGSIRVYQIDARKGNYSLLGNVITGSGKFDIVGFSLDISHDGQIVVVSSRSECSVLAFRYSETRDEWLTYGQPIQCVGNYSKDVNLEVKVRLSGDGSVVIIGETVSNDSMESNGKGFVHVHKFNNETWEQMGRTLEGEAPSDDFGFAVDVSLHGNKIVGCAPVMGSCRLFEYKVRKREWVQRGQTLIESIGFGNSVSLNDSGDRVVIGAVLTGNSTADESSYVRVLFFDTVTGSWLQVGEDVHGTSALFGTSVDLNANGGYFAVGEPNEISEGERGNAVVYENIQEAIPAIVPITAYVDSIDISNSQLRWTMDRLDVSNTTYAWINATNTTLVDAIVAEYEVAREGVYRIKIDNGNSSMAYFEIENDEPRVLATGTSSQILFATSDRGASNTNSTKSVTLVINFDDNPSDIHWVLVMEETQRNDRTILSYGPSEVYNSSLRNKQVNVTIDLSDVDPDNGITFYLTDDGNDGLCCEHGEGSVSLYYGANDIDPNELNKRLIFNTTAEGMMRWTKSIDMSQWLQGRSG